MKVQINNGARRIHVIDEESDIDEFYIFREGQSAEERLEELDIDISSCDVTILDPIVKRADSMKDNASDDLSFTGEETEHECEDYGYNYKEMIACIDHAAVVTFTPDIVRGYALSKKNYPNGICINVTMDNDPQIVQRIKDATEDFIDDFEGCYDNAEPVKFRLDIIYNN